MNLINEEEFSHLHVHTDYSLLDGLGNVKDYVARAKELGMNAVYYIPLHDTTIPSIIKAAKIFAGYGD